MEKEFKKYVKKYKTWRDKHSNLTRNHTENMLSYFGVKFVSEFSSKGFSHKLLGFQELTPKKIVVPTYSTEIPVISAMMAKPVTLEFLPWSVAIPKVVYLLRCSTETNPS